MKNPLLGKGLAVGIILLFVAIAFSPVINARNDTMFSKTFCYPKKDVSIAVLEYKPDGTIEKTIVNVSQKQLEELRKELNRVKEFNTKISIYKKYNLIPQNITAEKLRMTMEETSLKLQPKIENLKNYIVHHKHNTPYRSIQNYFCEINGFSYCGLKFLGGLSSIVYNINFFLFNLELQLLPSIDLFQFHYGTIGYLDTSNGILPDSTIEGTGCTVFLYGFVGYTLSYPPIIFLSTECDYVGFVIACAGSITGHIP